ncbi:c-type cytochrome [Meiothermus hypogaeus]|uniref:Cytochrome c552 n=2 Tax=Meiothermus hypogaeus TaxID=884155 RepID=A0A511R0B1_9DEIN|nr:c-type cytochrome [Meiothermus hypogaeus]RIH78867.1 Cytochrome c-552 [Meiothermus hypogaeus]GEM83040.1 cytochrome c552 [Meiothermus hypogaeus NBRC 106114]
MKVRYLVWVILLALAALWVGLGQNALPEGPGRELVLQKCQTCHEIGFVTRERQTRERWDSLISEMQGYGLKVTPEERATILDYLATRLAPGAAAPAPAQPQATTPTAGASVYNNCIGCHQATGAGIPGAFPPLAGHVPEILAARGGREWLIQVMLYGLQGQISVKGASYNGIMPGYGQLSNAEIAAVLTHIATQWGNALPAGQAAFTEAEVQAQRGKNLTAQQVLSTRQQLGLR